MKKLFSVALGVVMAAVAIPVHAAIQYNMETFSGGSWFSVDEKQTVYLNVKDRVRAYFNTHGLFDISGKTFFVLELDVHEFFASFFVISKFF